MFLMQTVILKEIVQPSQGHIIVMEASATDLLVEKLPVAAATNLNEIVFLGKQDVDVYIRNNY
jgi:hypothetical protein